MLLHGGCPAAIDAEAAKRGTRIPPACPLGRPSPRSQSPLALTAALEAVSPRAARHPGPHPTAMAPPRTRGGCGGSPPETTEPALLSTTSLSPARARRPRNAKDYWFPASEVKRPPTNGHHRLREGFSTSDHASCSHFLTRKCIACPGTSCTSNCSPSAPARVQGTAYSEGHSRVPRPTGPELLEALPDLLEDLRAQLSDALSHLLPQGLHGLALATRPQGGATRKGPVE